MTIQAQFKKNKSYSKESHLTNHICVKLIANTPLRFIYSIYYEMCFVVSKCYDRCYQTLGVLSKLLPRAGITVVYKCISALLSFSFGQEEDISLKKIKILGKKFLSNKTVISKGVLKMSEEAIEEVFILTIPA